MVTGFATPAPRTRRRVVLVSTYDLGRQPFGLASPAAWLRAAGHDVRMLDLAVEAPDKAALAAADVIAFHVPMHTAARLTARLLPWVRDVNPDARVCVYGLYAAVNAPRFASLGARAAIAGEFERALVEFVEAGPAGAAAPSHAAPSTTATAAPAPTTSAFAGSPPIAVSTPLDRLEFRVPDREGLPGLNAYARLRLPDGAERRVGATEASRGCKHQCRHCPVVPVYGGRFRVVPIDVVLADVDRLVEAGAEHVTFGDPDFWNGIGHAAPLVRRLHERHPSLTFDVTIKIEHLLRHAPHVAALRDGGCLFVTSAVESLDDAVLARLDKGHTRADFERVVALCHTHGLTLNPTFVAFTPWTTRAAYRDLVETLDRLDLVEAVAPIQLAIRLLVPAGSRLLDGEDRREWLRPFDAEALVHPWEHPDAGMDRLQRDVFDRVSRGLRANEPRAEVFAAVARLAGAGTPSASSDSGERVPEPVGVAAVPNPSPDLNLMHRRAPRHDRPIAPRAARFRRGPVPYLTEPWYC